ncbi:hypothetical protein [Nitrosococcus wardiae]|uniref:Uncharacterized protein n=1 Tax=Nitrosococcus wardiae TaxID=1814290 RepID=A0A4P7BZY7_9GAMM|nr:hypothetical protein [Nitrosococcus wardiae]QBQ54764.1 hypothetical protein E3U44_09770 [Nitrosococcus wardiae]
MWVKAFILLFYLLHFYTGIPWVQRRSYRWYRNRPLVEKLPGSGICHLVIACFLRWHRGEVGITVYN